MKTINLNQLAFRWYILAFISIIAISPGNAQKTLYVANPPLGNDNNDGTSIDTPFENIQKALDEAVSGVTTSIQVMGGTYKERLTWKQPGTANAPMILTNYSGQTVILDGKNATGSAKAMIEIFEKDYCTVKKLYIQNNIKKFDTEGIHVSGGRGIHVSGGEGIKILSCKIKNIGYEEWTPSYEGAISSENANPLLVVGVAGENAVTDLTVDGNEIYNCLTGYSEALTVAGDVAGFTIRNNIVHDNSNIGIVTAGHYGWTTKDWNENSVYNNLSDDIRSKNIARNGTVSGNLVYNCVTRSTNENGEVISSAGIYIDGGKDITLERNVSRNNGVGFSIGCEECKMNDPDNDVTGIIMRNNLSYNNNGAGLVFGSNKSGNNGPYAPISNCKALNNTFYKNLRTQPSGAEITLQHNSTENLIKQNIIYVDYAGAKCYQAIGNWGFSSEASFDNNLYSDIPSNNGCPRFSEHLTIEINAKIGDIVLDSGLRPLIDSPVFDSNVSPDEDLV